MDQIIKINTGEKATVIQPMTLLSLVSETNSFLNTPCLPFDFANVPMNPVELANSLFTTMFKNKGIGLTANQVGLAWAVFVVGSDDKNKQVFFNPHIIEVSPEEELADEGCLSFPHLYFKVKRPRWVKLGFQHVNGEQREHTFMGITARIILHEMDHILGKTMVQAVGKTTLAMAKEKRRKLLKKMERHGR